MEFRPLLVASCGAKGACWHPLDFFPGKQGSKLLWLLQAASGADIPEEATQTYKELFEEPHNEWNAEMESDDAASYLNDMDNPGIRGLIDGDGFDSGDVADWHSK
jgi:hypothetical protein